MLALKALSRSSSSGQRTNSWKGRLLVTATIAVLGGFASPNEANAQDQEIARFEMLKRCERIGECGFFSCSDTTYECKDGSTYTYDAYQEELKYAKETAVNSIAGYRDDFKKCIPYLGCPTSIPRNVGRFVGENIEEKSYGLEKELAKKDPVVEENKESGSSSSGCGAGLAGIFGILVVGYIIVGLMNTKRSANIEEAKQIRTEIARIANGYEDYRYRPQHVQDKISELVEKAKKLDPPPRNDSGMGGSSTGHF